MRDAEGIKKKLKSKEYSNSEYTGRDADAVKAKLKEKSIRERIARLEDEYGASLQSFNDRFANQKSGYVSDASDWYTKNRNSYSSITDQIVSLKNDIANYGKYYGEDFTSKVKGYLDGIGKNSAEMETYAKNQADAFSQFKSEDEYNKYIDSIKQQDDMMNLDLDAAAKEVDGLRTAKNRVDELTRYVTNSQYGDTTKWQNEIKSILKQYGFSSTDELDKKYNEKSEFYNQAKILRRTSDFENTAKNASDFDKFSKSGADVSNPEFKDSVGHYFAGIKYGADEVGNKVKFVKDHIGEIENGERHIAGLGEFGGTDWATRINKMNDAETAVYDYYVGKGENEKADEYLKSLKQTLDGRNAEESYNAIQGKTGLEIAFGLASGLSQFKEGVGNLFNGDEYIPYSRMQQTSQLIRDDLADNGAEILGSSLGQIAYDTTSTIGNMLPSIAISYATGGAASALGATTGAAQLAANVAGNVALGASAAGNEYQEMLASGMNKDQARAISLVQGAWEGASEYYLGSLEGLGGKFIGNALNKTKLAKGLELAGNGVVKAIVSYFGDAAVEGMEEVVQDIGSSVLNGVMTGDWEFSSIEELAYNFALGALTAGAMNGPSSIAGGVNTALTNRRYAQEYKGNTEAMQELVNDGLGTEDGTESKRIAEVLNKRLSKGKQLTGNQLRLQTEANNKSFAEEDKGKIKDAVAKRLTELGEQGDINAIADVIAKQTVGEDVTSAEKRVVKNSQYAERVNNELNPDNIVNGNFSSRWAEEIGTKKVNSAVYNYADTVAKLKTAFNNAPKENAAKVDAEQKVNDVQQKIDNGDITVDSKAPGIKRIESINDGKMVLVLDDGTVADSNDVEYKNNGEALVYEAVANIGYDVKTANAIVNSYKASDGISAEDYLAGVAEAYDNGTMGYSVPKVGKLTKAQTELAYNLGAESAKKAVAKKSKSINKRKLKALNKGNAKSKGRIYYAMDGKELTNRQSASLSEIGRVTATVTNSNVVLYASTEQNGKRVFASDLAGHKANSPAPNGFYKNGTIYLDINSGNNGEGTMLWTYAHELTHFIAEWSPEKFKVLSDFVLDNYAKDKRYNLEARIDKRISQAKADGRTLSRNDALEEIVADSMQVMFTDTNLAEKLAELNATDKNLFDKIKEWFTNLLAKIKELYDGLEPDTIEAQTVRGWQDKLEQLRDMFADALVDAGDTFSVLGEKNGFVSKDNPIAKIAKGEMESTRTERESYPKMSYSVTGGNPKLVQDLPIKGKKIGGVDAYTVEQIRSYVMEKNGFSSTDISNVQKFMDNMADFMDDAGVTFRFIGLDDVNLKSLSYTYNNDGTIKSVVLSAMVKNGDYPVNFDFTSICKKRKAMSDLVQKIADNGYLDKGVVTLTEENINRINQALRDADFETACLGCFVEAKRYNVKNWVESFIKKWNDAVLKVNPNADYFGFTDGKTDFRNVSMDRIISLNDSIEEFERTTGKQRRDKAIEVAKQKQAKGEPMLSYKNDALPKSSLNKLNKSFTLTEEFKDEIKAKKPSQFTLNEVITLIENDIVAGRAISNKQKVTKLVNSGAEYQKLLRPSDLLTAEGIEQIKHMPNFYSVLYGHYGSGTPKPIQGFTPYNSEIALLPENKGKKTLEEYIYSIAGVRMQSFSDFQIQNVYDYMQMVADLAARKLPAHAYTKEIAFAKILGMTGLKANLSVMFNLDTNVDDYHKGLTKYNPDIHTGEYATIVYEDEQGKWVYDVGDLAMQRAYERYNLDNGIDAPKRYVQSIGFADAVKLQNTPGYTKHIGIIGVGYSDAHILAMLGDNRIRYIIPYHSSGLPDIIKHALSIPKSLDYTSTQNNVKITAITDKNGNEVDWSVKERFKALKSGYKVVEELNKHIQNDGWQVSTKKAQNGHGSYDLYGDLQQTSEPRQTARNFMDWCASNGSLPLFYQFATHENYYKLLYDFNVYDNVSGEYAPQGAVTNTYPVADGVGENATKSSFDGSYLEDTISGYMEWQNRYNENLDGKLDDIVDTLAEKQSARDSEYIKLAQNPEKNEARLKELIADAARENGYDSPLLYHGTKRFGFTRINTTYSDDGLSFFATSNAIDKYRYIDLRSIAEQLGLEEYEDLSKSELADILKDYLNDVEAEWKEDESSDFNSARDGMWVRPVSNNSDYPIDFRASYIGGNRDVRYSDRASMTEERIDALIEDSGAGMRTDYARAWITSINPTDFLNMTLGTKNQNRDVFDTMPGDYGSTINDYDFIEGGLKKEKRQTPYLAIDVSTGQVVGHEGRHRMRALEKQGITSADIKIEFRDDAGRIVKEKNGYGVPLETIESLTISNQRGTGQTATIENVIPLNKANRDNILSSYGDDSAKIQYSDRNVDNLDTRTLLANALESAVQNDAEKARLEQYKGRIDILNKQQEKLAEYRRQIKDISFGKGKDRSKLPELKAKAEKLASSINRTDKELLKLEANKNLKAIVEREKTVAIRKAKAQGKDAVAKMREQRDTKIQAIKDKYNERISTGRERRTAAELKRKIKKIANDFQERLLGNIPVESRRYIPKGLVSSIVNVCMAIDPTGVDQNTKVAKRYENAKLAMLEIKHEYDKLKNSESEFSSEFNEQFSKNISDLADAVGGTPLRDMTLSQLQDVYDIMHDIKAMLTDATKQIGTGEAISNYQAGMEIMELMQYIKDKGLTTNAVSKAYRLWTLNPMRAIEMMSAYRTDTRLYKLFEQLDDGRRNAEQFKMDATKSFDDLRKTKADRKLFNDAVEKKIEFDITDIYGQKVKMTKMQAMQLVLTYYREKANDNRKHLETGAVIPDYGYLRKGDRAKAMDNKTVIGFVDMDMISKILSEFNDWDNKYLKVASKFFNEDAKNAINDVTIVTRHRLVAQEKQYIPYELYDAYIHSESEAVKFDGTIEGWGNLKSVLQNAGQPVVIRGLNAIVDKHIDSTAKYVGYAIPVRNFNKVFNMISIDNGPSVKKSIDDTWGTKAREMVAKAVTDIQSPRKTDIPAIIGKIKKGFVVSTLASNISVWMKQAASYPTAGAILSWKALAKGLAEYTTKIRNDIHAEDVWAEIDAHTATHWMRRQGLSMQELGEFNQSQGWSNWLSDKLGKASPMNWIQAMDVGTTAALWYACKAEVDGMGITKNSDEYWTTVTNLYNEVIEKTQPMYDSLHRAEATKNSLLSNIIMFQTQPIQNSGILYDGAEKYKMYKKMYGKDSKQAKRAFKQYKMAVFSQVASHLLFTMMTLSSAAILHKMNRYKDDDDEVTLGSVSAEFLKQFGTNYFSAIFPIAGSYAESALEKFIGGSRYDVLSDAVVDKINSSVNTLYGLKNPSISAVTNVVVDVASYFGIPAQNAINLVSGIWLNATDAMNGELGSFEAGTERTNSQNINRAYTAFRKGDYSSSTQIIQDIIANKIASGKTEKEAQQSVRSSITAKYKSAYLISNPAKKSEIKRFLISTGLYEDVDKTIDNWTKNK